MIIPKETIYKIIYYGNRAPSSHNAQMWKVFQRKDSELEIRINEEKILPYVDPLNREAWISIGAFVQNCILAAADLGVKVDVDFKDNFVLLRFDTSKALYTYPFIPLIEKRQTVRNTFTNNKNNSSKINRIISDEKEILFCDIKSDLATKIKNLAIQSFTQQLNNPNKLNELAEWSSFSTDIVKKEGISSFCMGLSWIERFVCSMTKSEKFMKTSFFKSGAIRSFKKQLKSCSGYVLITSDKNSKYAWFQAGRILQRFWLNCTANSLVVHPFSQLIEEENYYDKLKNLLENDKEVQLLLRIGNVRKLNPFYSSRREMSEVITQ
ncbi:MAG: hypothetical protein ACEPOW_13550 [Bacteroidales bacterium]